MRHDQHSLCWFVWLIQGSNLKSSDITFGLEAKNVDILGELKAAELSNDEDERSEEVETAPVDGDDGPGRQPPQEPASSQRSSPDSGLRRSSRLAQRHGGDDAQQRFMSSDGSSSDDKNFLATFRQD